MNPSPSTLRRKAKPVKYVFILLAVLLVAFVGVIIYKEFGFLWLLWAIIVFGIGSAFSH